jgi:hypothetical protein
MPEIMVCQLPLLCPYFNVQFFGYLTVDTLFDGPDEVAQPTALSALVNELIQNTYKVIAWEHVARAFRADY